MTNFNYDERLRTQTQDWMAKYSEHLTHACTLTIKQQVNGKDMDAERAWQSWENFCKFLNRTIYRKAAKRYGKSLVILPTLHGEVSGKQLHFHAAIGCVDERLSFDELKMTIDVCWRSQLAWTNTHIDIQPYRDVGWIGYMLHESVRLDLNSVDLTRCFLPRSLQ